MRRRGQGLLALGALAAIVVGAGLHLAGLPAAGDTVWAVSVVVMLVLLTRSVLKTLVGGDVGVDVIALLAMVGALAVGEYLAGAVVALMLSGGDALEAAAAGRARRSLTLLLERAPRVARRRRGDRVEDVAVEDVVVGDHLIVRAGEIVPVDGTVREGEAQIDESTLTGEAFPVTYARGDAIRSGCANVGEAIELQAKRAAADSAYAALVRLVRDAEAQQAPFVRMADRYAVGFLAVTLALAGLAWAASGDAVRAVAVLVVATPCPLILAAPIALISGLSRAAKAGVIVKGGAVIERLGDVRTVLLDKTGTLTVGTPTLERVVRSDDRSADELLRLAASLDQLSTHVFADALVQEAQRRGLRLGVPSEVLESAGSGMRGRLDGAHVTVGSRSFLAETGHDLSGLPDDVREGVGEAEVLVGVDGRLAGVLVLGDQLRADAHELAEALHRVGVKHVALVTGDRAAIAEQVARDAHVDAVYADCSPEQKLELVRKMQQRADRRPVMMVGDGVNDAPALALADVGIAMATAGATVSSEAADAVITGDRIGRVAEAISIGVRSLTIARQSVLAGIGLSMVAMVAAAFGYLPPVAGALLQEVIDVAVILNALRALRA